LSSLSSNETLPLLLLLNIEAITTDTHMAQSKIVQADVVAHEASREDNAEKGVQPPLQYVRSASDGPLSPEAEVLGTTVDEKEDIEASTAEPAAVLASEDYSVFTVPQKRAIVLAGSFLGLFSPVR